MVCQLLGDEMGLLIQFGLGLSALCGLLCKRYMEQPKRPGDVFLRDVSKQVVGSLVAHGINLLIAIRLAHHAVVSNHLLGLAPEEGDPEDQCMWYFMNFIVDVLLGLPMNALLLYILGRLALRYDWRLLQTGYYGTSILENTDRDTGLDIYGRQTFLNESPKGCCAWLHRNRSYLAQLGAWVSIVSFNKLLLYGCVLIPTHTLLGKIGRAVLSPLRGHDHLELVIVMVVVPMSLNLVQFWIQDNFLKAKPQEIILDDDEMGEIREMSAGRTEALALGYEQYDEL